MCKQNRYLVPKGTYTPGKEAKLILKGTKINILDIETDQLIVSHLISTKQGEIVKIIHPERDIHNSVDTIYQKAFVALGETENARALLDNIRKEKVRYCKDQFGVIINTVPSYELEVITKAVDYCVIRRLWSAGMFKETLEYLTFKKNIKVDPKSGCCDMSIPLKYRDLSLK